MKSNFHRIVRQILLLGFFLVIENLGTTAINRAQAFEIVDTDLEGVTNDTDVESQIIINEVMFYPEPGSYEWVELKNDGSNPVSIRGWGLTDEDGNWYKFPQDLPDVPGGDFVVVVFDGLGNASNEYNLDDGVITLHSQPGLVDIFENDIDQASLYQVSEFLYLPIIRNSNTSNVSTNVSINEYYPIVSFVAWGDSPKEDGARAYLAGLWPSANYIQVESLPGNPGVQMGWTIGRNIETDSHSPNDWSSYSQAESSLGYENRLPAPYIYGTNDGASICETQPFFSWFSDNATNYSVDLADNPEFNLPLYRLGTDQTEFSPSNPLGFGTYYFRVVAQNSTGHSSLSSEIQFNIIDCSEPVSNTAATATEKILPITPILQHKDSLLLNLGGDPECQDEDTPGDEPNCKVRWDSAHEEDGDLIIGNGEPVIKSNLDRMYCTRAAIAMIAKFFGGSLSQDRISFYVYSENTKDSELKIDDALGHGKGMEPSDHDVFSWALNNASIEKGIILFFSELKDWIDHDQPVLVILQKKVRIGLQYKTYYHSVVVTGYRESSSGNFILYNDPMSKYPVAEEYTNFFADVYNYYVPPADSTARSDEANLDLDTDNDGLTDFDEDNRFQTDSNNPDSDFDGILEKTDLREYVFRNNGTYILGPADKDGDGLRKERDEDNDHDGSPDGCEDTNRNGKYEPELGESNNFDSSDKKQCTGVLSFDTYNDGFGVITGNNVLTTNTDYIVTTSGTYSRWWAELWSIICPTSGNPEDAPEIPSPKTTNGKVGLDAEYVFAYPDAYSNCSNLPPAPYAEPAFMISVDNGITWFSPEPLNAAYNQNHIYQYKVTGKGFPIKVKQTDNRVDDNYGIMTIKIEFDNSSIVNMDILEPTGG